MRKGSRLLESSRETAFSFFASKPAPYSTEFHLWNVAEYGLPAIAMVQAALTGVVQRSDKITPPKVSRPPTK